MKGWERVVAEGGEACGFCEKRQSIGTPVLVIYLTDLSPVRRRRIRCQACANEPVNEEQLAQFAPVTIETATVKPVAPPEGFTRFDPRAMQLPIGDRE